MFTAAAAFGSRARPGAPPSNAVTLANFVLEGTGVPSGHIATFGHAFPQGELEPTDPVLLRRQDTNEPLRTQMNVLTQWPDNSVKTALLAAEMPSVADTATLALRFRVGEEHSDPGGALDLGTLLTGRTVVVKTWAPGNTTTPLWTFNAHAEVGADRWHQGPLAVSTRVTTAVPSSAVQNTSGSTGVITSVRLIVDITAHKTGFIEADVCFSNDRVMHSGGGIARFGYTIEIDGEVLYDQRPSSGVARDLLQYSQWIRRVGRNADGSIKTGRGQAREDLFCLRPDFDLLVRSKVQLNYDRSQAVSSAMISGAITNVLADAAGKEADPYWHWGLERYVGMTGGRPEIGYRTAASALWLRDGLRDAQIVAQRQLEAASTRAMFFYDWELGRWLNPVDWPRMSLWTGNGAVFSPAGTPRETATGLPADQVPTHNATDHIEIDHAHHGSFYWTAALLSGRRLAYDGLAARAAWVIMDNQKKANSTVGADTPNWRTLTPDYQTGQAWASRPWTLQTRSWAWDLRCVVDCAAILPDSYEGSHRIVYTRHVEALIGSYKDALPAMFSAGLDVDFFGLPVIHADGPHTPMYMGCFVFFGLLTALRLGLGGPHMQEIAERMLKFRADATLTPGSSTFNYRASMTGERYHMRNSSNVWAQDWDDVWTFSINAPSEPLYNPPADWSSSQGSGDYHRNTLMALSLGLLSDIELPVTLRAALADALVLLRSERASAATHPHPRIAPDDFYGAFFMTNTAAPTGVTWQWNSAPVVVPGQSFEVAGDAAPGALVGVVRFTGPVPRNSGPGRTPGQIAWEITNQPEGNPFTISMGGALRLVGNPPPAGTSTITVRARTYEGGAIAAGDPSGTLHLGAEQTVSVTVTAVAAEIVSTAPSLTPQVANTAEVGTVIATVTARGNAPITPSIQSGNTTLFEFVAGTGQTFELRVKAALSGTGTYPLTLRVANAHGQDEVSVNVEVTNAADAPVIGASQVFEMAETLSIGTAADPPTIAYTGDPPNSATFTAGNTGNRLALTINGADVELTNAAAIKRFEVTQLTPTVRLANVGGEDSKTITVNIIQPWVLRSAAPSAHYVGVWSIARRLVSNYTGPLIRIRRANDNAEQDIGFTASGGHDVLDESAVTSFVGANNWFIVTVYDQSINGFHMTQATAGSQPQGGTSGGFLRVGTNDRVGADFTSNKVLDTGTQDLSQIAGRFFLAGACRTGTGLSGVNCNLLISHTGDAALIVSSGAARLRLGNGWVTHSQAAGENANLVMIGRWQTGAGTNRNRITWNNQTVESNSNGNELFSGASQGFRMGTNGTAQFRGRIAEAILGRDVDMGDHEAAVLANLRDFYGV
jgi:hypothetical protein